MTLFRVLRPILLVMAAVAAAATGAVAEAAKAPPRQCFRPDNVDGFSASNDHTVYIRVRYRDVYRLDLMNDCVGLTFRQALGLKSTPGAGWICSPLDAEIVYRETGISQRCQVKTIYKLSPAEIAALPKRDRP